MRLFIVLVLGSVGCMTGGIPCLVLGQHLWQSALAGLLFGIALFLAFLAGTREKTIM